MHNMHNYFHATATFNTCHGYGTLPMWSFAKAQNYDLPDARAIGKLIFFLLQTTTTSLSQPPAFSYEDLFPMF